MCYHERQLSLIVFQGDVCNFPVLDAFYIPCSEIGIFIYIKDYLYRTYMYSMYLIKLCIRFCFVIYSSGVWSMVLFCSYVYLFILYIQLYYFFSLQIYMYLQEIFFVILHKTQQLCTRFSITIPKY